MSSIAEMAEEYRQSAALLKKSIVELRTDAKSELKKRQIYDLSQSYKELIGIATYLERYYSGSRTATGVGRMCSDFKPETQPPSRSEPTPGSAKYTVDPKRVCRGNRRTFPMLESYCVAVAPVGSFTECLTQTAERELSPAQFQAFKLRYIDGMTYRSIAEATGLNPTTARVTAERARKSLNDLLVCYTGVRPRTAKPPEPPPISREVYIEFFALLEQTKNDFYGKQLYRVVNAQLREVQMRYAVAYFLEKKSESRIAEEFGLNRSTVHRMIKIVETKLQTIIDINAIAILRITSEVDDIKLSELMDINKAPARCVLRYEQRRDHANAY